MNDPIVTKITWDAEWNEYTVDRPNWDGGKVVGLEEIATYIERDSQILLPIVVGETKNAYGLRMLKELAAEIRRLDPDAPDTSVRPHGYPGAGLGT